MKVKNFSKGAGNYQHLLDISSDYNNYSNLAYFISEYKKAKEIIAQCKNFYKNFLRNKLYTLDDLKKLDNINLLRFKFDWSEYLDNCEKLYLFIVYQYIEEQVKNNLTKYRFEFCKESKSHVKYYPNKKIYNVWDLICDKDTILGLNCDRQICESLINIYLLHKWKPCHSTEQMFNRNHFFDDALDCNYIEEGKSHKFKTIKLDLYDRKGWGNEEKIIKTKYKYEIIMFEEEELKLVEIFKEAGKRYSYLLDDIKFNPAKYFDTWNEFIRFRNDNCKKFEHDENDFKYASEETKNEYNRLQSHKGILCPVDYYINDTQYAIEAYEYLNIDFIKYYCKYGEYSEFLNYKSYERKNCKYYNLTYENLINSKYLKDRAFIKNTELLYHIQQVNPEYYKAKDILSKYDPNKYYDIKDNNELVDPYIPSNPRFYYVLIDNIPYKFTDCLDDVKIIFDEEENILRCTYDKEYKYKKWQWPSDTPWTVNTYSFSLDFDCANNEPLYYNYNFNTHEEKIRYKY